MDEEITFKRLKGAACCAPTGCEDGETPSLRLAGEACLAPTIGGQRNVRGGIAEVITIWMKKLRLNV
ncbi:MAG: hypothetical protein PVF83_11985 [Anaerolineales bacterium]